MPWIGLSSDGDWVIPADVADGERVRCSECDEQMFPRGPMSDGRARHFVHVATESTCSGGGGGESDRHRKWKSMVVSALRQEYDDAVRCEPEVPFDVSRTDSDIDRRWADALVEFDTWDERLGQGIVVEVQHKNKDKDIEATTYDYLTQSYSVFWADEGDFTDDRFKIGNLYTELDRGDTVGRASPFGTTSLSFWDPDGTDTDEQIANREQRWDDESSIGRELPDNIPQTDSDGHPVPRIPACNHVPVEISNGSEKTNFFECKVCGSTMYRAGSTFYYWSLSTATDHLRFLISNPPKHPDIWKHVDGEYECIRCGKRYPVDHDELLEQVDESA